ncbi:MAG: PKD domain-containing protein, partial [Saprospiraceae bacterium]
MKNQFYNKNWVFTLLLFSFLYYRVSAQCNPDIQIIPAQYCNEALPVCALDGYCIDMIPGSWGGEAAFCGGSSLQNSHWFAFKSDGNVIDINIPVNNCAGSGVQWAFYDSCNSLLNALLCNGSATPPGDTIRIIYDNPTESAIYYIVIDGFSGAGCHLEFDVNSGVIGVPLGEIIDSTLIGENLICPQQQLTYSFAGFENGSSYIWSFDGVVYDTTSSPNFSITFPELDEGLYTLCVRVSNGCVSDVAEQCWQLEVDKERTIEAVEFTCAGDSVLYQDQYYQIGTYFIPYQGPVSCIADVNLSVREYSLTTDTTQTVYICAGDDVFEYDGIEYQADSIYENFSFENEAGCRYSGKLLVRHIDVPGLEITSPVNGL